MTLECCIQKSYKHFHLQIDFKIQNGVTALLGASGSGKSLTLKCLAGIEKPDCGFIRLNDRVLFDAQQKINLRPQKRKIGYLFQDYALFPNMTVAQNIACGLNHRSDKAKVTDLINAFQLQNHAGHYPAQLSGGQKQRCALARIMAGEPDLILLDEPFSALDSHLKWQIEMQTASILKKFDKPVLLVSHDRDEVYRLCDRITVIHDGKNEAVKEKWELFYHPETYHGALLTGCKNITRLKNGGQTDWGIHFSDIPAHKEYVGIRARQIRPAFQVQNTTDYVVFDYTVCSEVEDTFSFILMIQPSGGTTPIRWEILKSVRRLLDAHPKTACISKDQILYLNK